jgi:hypothetical protein
MRDFRGTERASVKKKRQIDVDHTQEGIDPGQKPGQCRGENMERTAATAHIKNRGTSKITC